VCRRLCVTKNDPSTTLRFLNQRAVLLAMRLHRVHPDGITIDCPLRNDLRNNAGVAHGCIATAMADATVGGAIQRHVVGGMGSTPWS
jgi:acyl-coenzyme A thioesterase PaaI-like protein